LGVDAPLVAPGVGLEAPHQDLQERRLADAVGTDDGHTLAAPDLEAHALEHPFVAVGLADGLDGEHVLPARTLLLKGEVGRPPGALGELGHLDLLDLLETALGLPRLRGLGAEALHEGPLLSDLPLGAGDLRLLALAGARLLDEELRVVARV